MKREFILFIMFMLLCNTAFAISDEKAYQCLLGEVRGESKETIINTAHALRNRDYTQGVCGCRFIATEEEKKYLKATGKSEFIKMAWKRTLVDPDPTNGATHWENVKAFGYPDWGDNPFYKTHEDDGHVYFVRLYERPKDEE